MDKDLFIEKLDLDCVKGRAAHPGARGIQKAPRWGKENKMTGEEKKLKWWQWVIVAFFWLLVIAGIMLAIYQFVLVPNLEKQLSKLSTAVPPVAATPTTAPTEVPTQTPTPTAAKSAVGTKANDLVNPVLFDAGEDPAGEADPGLFDIGVNADQLGIVFGWDLSWGKNSIKGEGCEMVILPPGWYENFSIMDGRYEIYTLPSADPEGWTKVLVDQRVTEQSTHYGCDPKAVPPVWEGGE